MEIIDIAAKPLYEDEWRRFLPENVPIAFGEPWFMAYAAADNGRFCGIIIGEKNEKGTAKSPKADYTILWLFVREDMRGKGIGKELVTYFFKNSPHAVRFLCDVEADNESFIGLMRDCGMGFSEDERVKVELTAKDMSENGLFKGRTSKIEGLIFFDDLDPWDLKVYLMWIEEHLVFKHTIDIKDYDAHLSCVVVRNDKPVGYYIIKKYPRGLLEPEFMNMAGGSKMVIMLLRAVNERVLKTLSADTPVRLVARRKEGLALLEKLFPEREKTIIRHGEMA
ncbi:MAG: GNAT family N-acetyltransferase [Lachnospiraceae bacterium]|nr:GNAT family N-acetyltransferase [Lachnospiraceae bacterium]